MVVVSNTRVIVPCIVPTCHENVVAVFEPGEPNTYECPGYGDWWYLEEHNGDSEHEHINLYGWPDDFQAVCDRVAVQSFDSYMMDEMS